MRISVLFLAAIMFLSCGDEMPTDDTSNKYASGVFIVNQGNFGNGTGTLTYYDGQDSVFQNVFQEANDGQLLGNVAQSMITNDHYIFIAVNNAGKVEVLERSTLHHVRTIDKIDQPRYFYHSDEEKIYLTSWGSNGVSGKLYEINGVDALVSQSLLLGSGPEKMISVGEELYIAQSGGYGIDSNLIVYNPELNEINNQIAVGDNPVGIVEDRLSNIWVLCAGAFDFIDPANNTPGALVKISDGNIIARYDLETGASNLIIDPSGERLYFLSNGKIISHEISNAGFENNVIYENFGLYTLAVHPETGEIYAGDAKDYVSNGEIIVLSPSGEIKKKIQAGIIPGFIYFID